MTRRLLLLGIFTLLAAQASAQVQDFSYDDGDPEAGVRLIGGGEFAWLHAFDAGPGGDQLVQLSTTYGIFNPSGTPLVPGQPGRIAVWDDPSDDWDPSDLVLLYSAAVVSSQENTDLFVDYALPDVAVSGVFFIGATLEHGPTAGFPGPLDLGAGAPDDAVWSAGDATQLDLSDLGAGSLPIAEFSSGGWMLRARGAGSGNVGSDYCFAIANSISNLGARISATGSASLADTDLTLVASNAPASQFAIFYFGPNRVNQSFGNGRRCVGGSTMRMPVLSEAGGSFTHVVDFTSFGADLAALTTVNFQCWYRDPADGGAAFNLSNALEVIFVP